MGQDILVQLCAAARSPFCAARRGAPLSVVAMFLACLCAQPASGQDRLDREGRIKAALILNIAKLVTWPADSSTDLIVCVWGEPRFATALGAIEGQIVQGRPVTVTEIAEPREARECQLVFIGAAVMARLAEVRATLSGLPVLTVGDAPSFAQQGGAIGFSTRHNRVQIELNAHEARTSGLGISSQLLRLATIVDRPTGTR